MTEVTLEEAANLLNMDPSDLTRQRRRGLEPGKLGYAVKGEVFFDVEDLRPYLSPHVEPITPEELYAGIAEWVENDFTILGYVDLDELVAEGFYEDS